MLWSSSLDISQIFGFLNQNVDDGLFFLGGSLVDDGLLLGRDRGSLDEDNFVVLLTDALVNDSLLTVFFLIWWWDMDVDVFLDQRLASRASASETSAEPAGATASEGRALSEATTYGASTKS